MAITNFIPELWSRRILANLNKAHVYTQAGVANRDYEGEIRGQGDTVHINALGRVNVRTYSQTVGLADPEQLTSTQQNLLIDQAKEFNFRIDDIDAAQASVALMADATREAAYALSDVADKFQAALYTGAHADNLIGSDAAPSNVDATTAYDRLVDLGTRLDNKDVPDSGRWAVLPPEFVGYLVRDERFIKTGTAQAEGRLANRVVGEAAGFTLLKSNNAPAVNGDGTTTFDNRKVIAGHPMAWSFAEQITKTEAYRPDKFFADALRGLHVYGGKVVRPEALAVLSYASTV